MTIDQKYLELIHADIDGELSDKLRVRLVEFLQKSDEGRQVHNELSRLCRTISSAAPLDPPPYLRQLILSSIKPARKPPVIADRLKAIFTVPALMYCGAFAAGIVLTIAFVAANHISRRAFDDPTELVGTVSSKALQESGAAGRMNIGTNEIAGMVTLSNAGPDLALAFDLSAKKRVKIIADFSDPDIWFSGFAQQDNAGTSIEAEAGRVTLYAEGKRQYTMYLHHVSAANGAIKLRFYVDNALIHEGELRSEERQ